MALYVSCSIDVWSIDSLCKFSKEYMGILAFVQYFSFDYNDVPAASTVLVFYA